MSTQGSHGFQQLETFASEFNATRFLIESLLATVRTATFVKVIGCTNSGGLSKAGTVDVQPLVNQVDGAGNSTPHGIIYKCLYSRMQGGANAIIMDPQAGDIGVMIFSDRDTSKVIATGAQAAPGSNRKFDMADGVYLGWCLNGLPTQFIRYSAAGIDITSPTAITMEAPSITMTAPQITANASTGIQFNTPELKCSGDIIDNSATNAHTMAQMRSIYNTHTHGGVTTGGGTTSGPSATE